MLKCTIAEFDVAVAPAVGTARKRQAGRESEESATGEPVASDDIGSMQRAASRKLIVIPAGPAESFQLPGLEIYAGECFNENNC